MIDDVRDIIEKGINFFDESLPEIRKLASHDDWRKREDAATALVEISKKKEDEVVNVMMLWADEKDSNIRRAASEGLRGVARRNPEKILPMIEKLKTDESLYVRKSVAALLRAISKKNPEFVIDLCKKWAKMGNENTNWIIKQGIKKLSEKQQKEIKSLIDEGVAEKELVAYCGLYCGDCFFYKGEIANLAKELRKKLREAKLNKTYQEFSKFAKEFKDYPVCYSVLGAMVKMKCKGCRDGGGPPFCKIRKCSQKKEFEGCWDCNEFGTCRKLDFLNPNHGDAHIKNLRKIKRYGIKVFIEGKRYW